MPYNDGISVSEDVKIEGVEHGNSWILTACVYNDWGWDFRRIEISHGECLYWFYYQANWSQDPREQT